MVAKVSHNLHEPSVEIPDTYPPIHRLYRYILAFYVPVIQRPLSDKLEGPSKYKKCPAIFSSHQAEIVGIREFHVAKALLEGHQEQSDSMDSNVDHMGRWYGGCQ